MNTHDIELPPLPDPYGYFDNAAPGWSNSQVRDAQRAAIEAERLRILNCIEREYRIALAKYEYSYDHYWDGMADGFDKAEQIVKGEN